MSASRMGRVAFIAFSFSSNQMEFDVCPSWLLSKLCIRQQSRQHFAFFASTLSALVLLPVITYIPHVCLMQAVLGIPCPGCGISHSLTAILRLNLVGAWQANPAGTAVASCCGFQLLARPIAMMSPRTGEMVSKASHHISRAAVGSLLLMWISRVI